MGLKGARDWDVVGVRRLCCSLILPSRWDQCLQGVRCLVTHRPRWGAQRVDPAATSHAVVLAIDTTGSVAGHELREQPRGRRSGGGGHRRIAHWPSFGGRSLDGEFAASDATRRARAPGGGSSTRWGQSEGSFSVSEDYERVEAVEWIENKALSFPIGSPCRCITEIDRSGGGSSVENERL